MGSLCDRPTSAFLALLVALCLITLVDASSGDRNPTFQHCLKGCQITYCDPSQPPIAFHLRLFGWTCLDNCKYSCAHSFTDNIRSGGRWHQFYGKWPFYRLGPVQEPFSVFMSLGNLWVNLRGLEDVRRRVRVENNLRRWLEVMAYIQINTWVWSTVFHTRDTPFTERMDYLSATLTISYTLLYTLNRVPSIVNPSRTSRLAVPTGAIIAFLFISHWTYLLSFPTGSFPYGYHTKFNLVLASVHNILWILFSLSFFVPLPSITILGRTLRLPQPYPPLDPLRHKAKDAVVPAVLVLMTLFAMSFELLDFPPFFRVVDAHSLWHAATIPLTLAWWAFLISDAIEMEGALMSRSGYNPPSEKMPLTGARSSVPIGLGFPDAKIGQSSSNGNMEPPQTPTFAQIASGASPLTRARSKSPGLSKGDRRD